MIQPNRGRLQKRRPPNTPGIIHSFDAMGGGEGPECTSTLASLLRCNHHCSVGDGIQSLVERGAESAGAGVSPKNTTMTVMSSCTLRLKSLGSVITYDRWARTCSSEGAAPTARAATR